MSILEYGALKARMPLGLGAALVLGAALLATRCGKSGDVSGPAGTKSFVDTVGIVPRDSSLTLDTLRLASLNMSIGFPVAQLFFKNMAVDTIAFDALTDMYARYTRGYPTERIKTMAKVIVAESLDVVGLQEVMVIRKTDTLINDFMTELVKEISAQGGPAYTVFRTVMNDTILKGRRAGDSISIDFREGQALLVKPGFTVVDSIRYQYFNLLTIPTVGEPKTERGADYMRLKSPKGVEFQVFNTHLEVFISYTNSQAAELSKLADRLQIQVPIAGSTAKRGKLQILLGDFNALPADEPSLIVRSRGFLDTFDGVSQDSGGTCCVSGSALWRPDTTFSNRRIDYVMARGLVSRVFSRTNVKGAYTGPGDIRFLASDHRMVVAKVVIQ